MGSRKPKATSLFVPSGLAPIALIVILIGPTLHTPFQSTADGANLTRGSISGTESQRWAIRHLNDTPVMTGKHYEVATTAGTCTSVGTTGNKRGSGVLERCLTRTGSILMKLRCSPGICPWPRHEYVSAVYPRPQSRCGAGMAAVRERGKNQCSILCALHLDLLTST